MFPKNKLVWKLYGMEFVDLFDRIAFLRSARLPSLSSLHLARMKRERDEPCLVCGHYHNDHEPCSTCGHIMTQQEKKQCESVLPTAILPGFLYLGSYDTASRSEMLKAMAITHILNVGHVMGDPMLESHIHDLSHSPAQTVPACTELYKNTFKYHTVTSTPVDFQECFDFIESVQQTSEGKVLVYCMSGLSKCAKLQCSWWIPGDCHRKSRCQYTVPPGPRQS